MLNRALYLPFIHFVFNFQLMFDFMVVLCDVLISHSMSCK